MSLENSQIAKCFKNQTIFLTGGTGLVGKLLIEKLIRNCWDLRRIYVLMRPKNGITAEKRFEELFDSPCFDLIKDKNLREKVFLINGDCNQPSLGISPEDVEILKKEASCVFHVAANVKFDQTLKEASYNVRATKDILELVGQMTNLKVFVYVSTAYSNCIHSHIKEDFYEPPLKPEVFFDLVEQVDEGILDNMTPALLDKWPNTYVYWKSISEDLIKSSTSGKPTAIIRPSIILNTLDEPIRGWIDNTYGVMGLIFGGNLGVVRSFCGGPKNKIDVVPADHVCNCILAATWKTIQEGSGKTTVYNCVGEHVCGEQLVRLNECFYWEFPSDKYMWYKSFRFMENKSLHTLYTFLHLMPLYLIDFVYWVLGKPPKVVKTFKHIDKALLFTSHFATHEWTFGQENVKNLWKDMSEDDRKIFTFNKKIPDWREYYRNCFLGMRLYLLKDPIETVPKGKKKLRILFVLHYLVIGLLLYCTFSFIMFVFGLF